MFQNVFLLYLQNIDCIVRWLLCFECAHFVWTFLIIIVIIIISSSSSSSSSSNDVFSVHAMKAYRRSRGIAPLILNLGTRWR
jgi:hypothetical protein